METTAPLLQREANEPIAFLRSANALVGCAPGVVSTQQFLQHVYLVAERLPDKAYMINLCANRYLFVVAFCAALVRRQTNLLPPNNTVLTQENLAQQYPNSYLVHDGIASARSVLAIDFRTIDFRPQSDSFRVPEIALQQLAAITFTSGSTAESQPIHKTWNNFIASSTINSRYMLPAPSNLLYQLATVPGQHMWGLETSVLLPLFQNVCAVDDKPLYPADIQAALAQLPAPRLLTSTPVHLRALCQSGMKFERVQRILCATAPLTTELASAVEVLFDGELHEIYGCSEVGSMAVRRAATEPWWQLFEGLSFDRDPSTGQINATAEHLPEPTPLQDIIEFDPSDSHRFRLAGRHNDMIQIAGKRGSLNEINAILSRFTGLLDGVVFLPEQSKTVPRLVAIVTLRPGVSKDQLHQYLRGYLDSALLPRPIFQVDALPREQSGKLSIRRLQAIYEQQLEKFRRINEQHSVDD